MTIPDSVILELIAQVNEIEEELGLNPGGVYADVRVRLDILESRINNPLAPSPNVPNPFTIGNDGITISTGAGFPTEDRLPGSLYLRTDGYADEGVYSRRPDGYWHQVASSDSGSGVQVVSNIAALSAIAVTTGDNGALAFMLSLKDIWSYNSGSALTTDGITVIAANGPGRWERLNVGSADWRAVPNWFIDSSVGNDQNSGTSSGSPLKTFAELYRRWGPSPYIPQQTFISLLNTIPHADSINFNSVTAADSIFISGTKTTLASGTITTYLNNDPGTAFPKLTDTSMVSFSPYVGKRIRFVDGAAAGTVAWIMNDEGSNTATISVPTTILGQSEPGDGDSYVIEDLTHVLIDKVDVLIPSASTYNLVFSDLALYGNDNQSLFHSNLILFGCDTTEILFSGIGQSTLYLIGDFLPFEINYARTFINQCASITTTGFNYTIGTVINTVGYGSQLFHFTQGSTVSADNIGIFNYSDVGIAADQNSSLIVGDNGFGTGIWGNNVAYPFSVQNGGKVLTTSSESDFPAPKDWLKVVSTGFDTIIDGIARTYDQLPFTNKYTGAGIHSWDFIYGPGGIEDIVSLNLAVDVDDYNFGSTGQWFRTELVRVNTTAPSNITGIIAVPSDVSRKTILNVGASNLTLKNNDGASSPQNRILTFTGSDVVLTTNQSIDIYYDFNSSIWRTL